MRGSKLHCHVSMLMLLYRGTNGYKLYITTYVIMMLRALFSTQVTLLVNEVIKGIDRVYNYFQFSEKNNTAIINVLLTKPLVIFDKKTRPLTRYQGPINRLKVI